MKEDLIKIGSFSIKGYGTMIAIGIITAYLILEARVKKRKLNPDDALSITVWCAIMGLIGAKLLYYIVEIKDIIADPSLLLNFANGFVVYGGIITGVLTGYICCKVKKLNILQWFDLVIPEVAFAQGFGRLGCFMAGCCYGEKTDSWFHIEFTASRFAPNHVWLYPTQLMSSALDFLNCAILIFVIGRFFKKAGSVMGAYLTFYSTGRFILEFFRGDIERGNVGILSTSQFISIFIFIFGVVFFILCQKFSAVPAPVDVTPTEEQEMAETTESATQETE